MTSHIEIVKTIFSYYQIKSFSCPPVRVTTNKVDWPLFIAAVSLRYRTHLIWDKYDVSTSLMYDISTLLSMTLDAINDIALLLPVSFCGVLTLCHCQVMNLATDKQLPP